MKIYGAILSPFVRKAIVVANLKGLDYESVTIIPGAQPEDYFAISPLGKIPALEDGDVTLCDSSIICEYLEDQYPDVAVLPDTPALRGRSRWLEEYADSKLVECCGGIFFERIAKPMLMKEETDEARVQDIIDNQIPDVFDYLETQLPSEGFIFGDQLFTADISIVCPFINAGYATYQVDGERWPVLAGFIERVKAHPVVAAALAAEAEVMTAMLG